MAPLRRVVLHRPGRELERVLPDTCGSLLFDDIPWLPAARREHDAFAGVLRGAGVDVVYLDDLLSTALADGHLRAMMIDRSLSTARIGDGLARAARRHLSALTAPELAEVLVGGLCLDELDEPVDGLVSRADPTCRFVMEPLSNQMFMRDSMTVLGSSISGNRFTEAAREREAVNIWGLLRHEADRLLWPAGTAPAPVEGGDVAVLGNGCVLIGIGARTTPAGAEFLAARILDRGLADTVLAVCLPRSRQTMHLDTVLTMVDRDALLVSPVYLANCAFFRLDRAPGGDVRARAVDDFRGELARALAVPDVRFVPTGGDDFTQRREQWSDGANVLALAPGRVVAYDRNVYANESMTQAGIEVLTIPSGELSRGRGGPHCLSCPLLREE